MKLATALIRTNSRPGIPLKIGGIALAHEKGLGGHSDGDVLLHAITDALLGAVAAPDIGALFPPSDPKWKGADSVVFLREALQRVRNAGYAVANIDASLILAAPKIGPHAKRRFVCAWPSCWRCTPVCRPGRRRLRKDSIWKTPQSRTWSFCWKTPIKTQRKKRPT